MSGFVEKKVSSSVIICINPKMRSQIEGAIKDSQLSSEIRTAMHKELGKLRNCDANLLLDFENAHAPAKGTTVAKEGKKTRKKRKPSAYNLYVSECMKSPEMKSLKLAKDRMKACAVDWKKGGPELKKKFEEKLRALA